MKDSLNHSQIRALLAEPRTKTLEEKQLLSEHLSNCEDCCKFENTIKDLDKGLYFHWSESPLTETKKTYVITQTQKKHVRFSAQKLRTYIRKFIPLASSGLAMLVLTFLMLNNTLPLFSASFTDWFSAMGSNSLDQIPSVETIIYEDDLDCDGNTERLLVRNSNAVSTSSLQPFQEIALETIHNKWNYTQWILHPDDIRSLHFNSIRVIPIDKCSFYISIMATSYEGEEIAAVYTWNLGRISSVYKTEETPYASDSPINISEKRPSPSDLLIVFRK